MVTLFVDNRMMMPNYIIRTVAIVGVLLLPLVFVTANNDPTLISRFIVLSLMVAVGAGLTYIQLHNKKQAPFFSLIPLPVHLTMGSFLLFGGISLLNTYSVAEGIFELLKTILFFSLFYIMSWAWGAARDKSLRFLSRMTTISAIIISWMGILQYFDIAFKGIPGIDIEGRSIYATLVNKNLYASFLLLCLPFVVAELLNPSASNPQVIQPKPRKGRKAKPVPKTSSSSNRWMVAYVIALVGIILGISLAFTRSALVGLVLFGSFVPFIWYARTHKIAQRWTFAFLGILLLGGLTVTAYAYLKLEGNTWTEKYNKWIPFEERTKVRINSTKERIMIWNESTKMILDNPITGVGLGNWKVELPKYGVQAFYPSYGERFFIRSHNDFIGTMAEVGILGGLAYLGFFLLILFYGIRGLAKAKHPHHRVWIACMLGGILAYMAVATFSFPKERILPNVLLILMGSVIVALHHRYVHAAQKPSKNVSGRILMIGIMLLAAGAFSFGLLRFDSDTHVKKCLTAKATGNWSEVVSETNKSLSIANELEPTSATPLVWYRGLGYFSQNQFEMALHDFLEAEKLHPAHLHNLNNIATCYNQLSKPEQAIEYYIKATDQFPDFKEALLNLSAVYFNTGQYEKAFKAIRRCTPSNNPKVWQFQKAISSTLKKEGYTFPEDFTKKVDKWKAKQQVSPAP